MLKLHSPSPKLECLTSLRFFAALLIVVHHTVPRAQIEQFPYLKKFCFDHGVSFFFVLSGFILTYVYGQSRSVRWRDFFAARFARIWPAHVVALGLGFALGAYGLGRIWTLPLNVAMLHSWLPVSASYFSYNMLSWSISTEFGFYLLFPLLVMDFERTWHWKLLGSALLTAGMIAACEWLTLPGYTHKTLTISNHGLVYISPLARLFEFVLGMSVSVAFFRMRDLSGPKLLWTAAEGGSVALAIINACSIGLFWGKHPALNEYFLHSSSTLSLALVVLVFALQKGYISQLLAIRPLVYLGEISYSIYLLHAILYGAVSKKIAGDAIDAHLIFWPLLLVSAMLMYEGVEGPLRTRLRRLLASRPSIAPEPAISQPERRAA